MADRTVDRTDDDRTTEVEDLLREMFAAGELEVLAVDGDEPVFYSRRAAARERS